ncbi:MAG: argininosuccinate lyase [Anaerolineae bacterium]|nr:argininosuccinate lyase [Anaerolineae bacterium]
MTLWGGVFQHDTDDSVRKLNDSLHFDWRLFDVDITGSQAWAGALLQAGLINQGEHASLSAGLDAVRQEFIAGEFEPAPGDEDIHTAVERRLTEVIGPVAGKLHTGRSRNDQVATDLRLWVLEALPSLINKIVTLQEALLAQAGQHLETVMPGYTHLQPAQPITVAHWLASFVQMLQRDAERFNQLTSHVAQCPLGSGALAGTPYPIDRNALASALGFSCPTANSLDAVSDRDYVAEFLFNASLLMTHLSRFAEDVIMFSNPGFGFITLDDRYSTGSSLMPQKRNPDPLELARGKTGRVQGHLAGFLTTCKALPSGYNKDLQEDKEPLFDTFDTLMHLLPVMIGLVATMRFNPTRMAAALEETMLATDLADYLVLKGIPFRQAHHLAGQIVRKAEDEQLAMSALPLEAFQQISAAFGPDVYAVFDFKAAVARRNVIGGPAPEAVRKQTADLQDTLKKRG